MGFLDTLLGRTKPKKADLNALFALPGVAVTLEAEAGLRPAGAAAVCFKPASGQVFKEVTTEMGELLRLGADQSGSTLEQVDDTYGYHWVVVRDPDLEDLVSNVHMVNATMSERGFDHLLLATVFPFLTAEGGAAHLVYAFKRGTFYPFVPAGTEKRDNQLELTLRGVLDGELPVEADLARWYPIWGVPVP